jgi:hypothetical protein
MIGYLTHDEFRKMIRAMGVKLTDQQISEVSFELSSGCFYQAVV